MLFQSLFRLLSRLPLPWLHRIGGWAGWLTYKASPAYARRLRENLFNALGREDEAVLRAAVVEAGRQALELPFIWGRPSSGWCVRCSPGAWSRCSCSACWCRW